MKVKVKICCISSVEEAGMAIEYGASAIGLVGSMPSGPGIIGDNLISEIVKSIPPPISTFLLTQETKAAKIIEHYRKVNTSTIQIVDRMNVDEYILLKKELPHVKIVQVIHVLNENSIKEAIGISTFVDAVLLDSGNPNLKLKILGGTGRTHDWSLSKKIQNVLDIPVFLAGGINHRNVNEAISIVQPFGIDLCSSLRTKGKLDPRKLKDFFDELSL